ncbi:MAG: hypothetical protein RLZZ374_467 [Cyanobacteriota bacterium]|jgi:hypothetical protein
MFFNRKGSFFLNLDDQAPAEAAQVAPVRAPESKAKADKTSTPVAISAAAAPAAAADPSPTTNTPAPTTGVTTAEAIAAELRAAQEARPAQTFITFAPERVSAGGALPMARRKGGANLAGFKAMAGSLFGK